MTDMRNRRYSGLSRIEVLAIMFALLVLVALILPARAGVRAAAKRAACASNMSQIGKAMIMYSQNPDNGGLFPTCSVDAADPELGDSQTAISLLCRSYVQDARVFWCPADSEIKKFKIDHGTAGRWVDPGDSLNERSKHTSYSYSPGKKPAQSIVAILADRTTAVGKNSNNHGADVGQNVLLANGTVELLTSTKNNMGAGENGFAMIDNDIYSNAPEPNPEGTQQLLQAVASEMTMRSSKKLTIAEAVVLLAIIALVASLVLPLLAKHQELARRATCAKQIMGLGKVMLMYAQNPDNGNCYPTRSGDINDSESGDSQEALNLLYRSYVNDSRVFRCPSDVTVGALNIKHLKPTTASFDESEQLTETHQQTSYSYSPGKSPDNGLVAILADKSTAAGQNSDNHGGEGQNVLLANGTVEFRTDVKSVVGNAMIDNDIYSGAPEKNLPKELNSFCRPLPPKPASSDSL